MEDYELRWQRPSATPRRDYRASSASRDYRASSASRDYQRESSVSRDMRESSVMSSSMMASRNVRATSVLPASLKHYDELAEADEDYMSGSGYLNRGLYQAKRAISEAKDILRGASVPRESSVSRMVSTSAAYDKSSRLEEIKEFSSDILREREANKGAHETGTYKITVTPQADYWSTRIPRRLYTRSTVAALLAAYSPRNFPDFIFGRYGGNTLQTPVSATSDYYDGNRHLNMLESSVAATTRNYNTTNAYEEDDSYDATKYNRTSVARNYDRSSVGRNYDRSSVGRNYDRSSVGRNYDRSSVGAYEREGSRRRSFEDEYVQPTRPRMNSYDNYFNRESSVNQYDMNDNRLSSRYNYDYNLTENSTNIIKDKKKSKYYHYFIPRHVPGTPMRGGYLVNAGRDYGWKY